LPDIELAKAVGGDIAFISSFISELPSSNTTKCSRPKEEFAPDADNRQGERSWAPITVIKQEP
jgi:hypothetical protein